MLLCMGGGYEIFRFYSSQNPDGDQSIRWGPRSFWADRLGLRHDGRAEEALRINQMISPPPLLLKLTPWEKPTTVSSSPCKQV